MRVESTILIPCSVENAWETLKQTKHLVQVSAPVLGVSVTGPPQWKQGLRYRLSLKLFGWFPIGEQDVKIECVDSKAKTIKTKEQSPFIKKWDHQMSLWADSQKQCFYHDRIDIQAGWFTPIVSGFAKVLYRHRQRKWRKLVSKRY